VLKYGNIYCLLQLNMLCDCVTRGCGDHSPVWKLEQLIYPISLNECPNSVKLLLPMNTPPSHKLHCKYSLSILLPLIADNNNSSSLQHSICDAGTSKNSRTCSVHFPCWESVCRRPLSECRR